jgi:hypothetical protein
MLDVINLLCFTALCKLLLIGQIKMRRISSKKAPSWIIRPVSAVVLILRPISAVVFILCPVLAVVLIPRPVSAVALILRLESELL